MINKCINFIQEVVFAQSCLNCGRLSKTPSAICSQCLAKLPANGMCCRQCALPLESVQQLVCGHCQKTPPGFDSAFIPFIYSDPVDQWIWKFKFRNDLVSGKLLADLFLHQLRHSPTAMPEVLVPVPLHSSRLRQRGFNQSTWLARHVGRQLGIPVDYRTVERRLKTPPQHELDMKKRTSILRNAFMLNGNIGHHHVAIVDDVLTTGSTVNEITKLLRYSGCSRIDAWAIARTPAK
jgi:ComF family protein